MEQHGRGFLEFPTVAAVAAHHKRGHGLICTPGLLLVIRGAVLLAFAAGKLIRHGLGGCAASQGITRRADGEVQGGQPKQYQSVPWVTNERRERVERGS